MDSYESKGTYKNATYKDDVKDGPSESYYDNGQLDYKLNYKNGVEDGPFETYYGNGQLRSKGTYRNGVRFGPYESYFVNGQLWVKEKLNKMENSYLIKLYAYINMHLHYI
jgi:antitoxin component YwqK of YwqJK toxin-antitoxin module